MPKALYIWFDFTPSLIIFFGLIFLMSSFKLGAAPYHFWEASVYQGSLSLVNSTLESLPHLFILWCFLVSLLSAFLSVVSS